MKIKIFEGKDSKRLTKSEKESIFLPYIQKYGNQAFSYATLQENMDYALIEDVGFVAYRKRWHPAFAPLGRRVTLGDIVCNPKHRENALEKLHKKLGKRFLWTIASEEFSSELRKSGYKLNSVGYEPEIHIQEYPWEGGGKFQISRRARNEAQREGVEIKEECLEDLSKEELFRLKEVSDSWLKGRPLKDREIDFYARRPVFASEPNVRKFLARNDEGEIIGFAFYDPIFNDGEVTGYSANIIRTDENATRENGKKFQKLPAAIHREAGIQFAEEGRKSFNLCIAPFDKVEAHKFNDDKFTQYFIMLANKFGDKGSRIMYNFGGLSRFKGDWKVNEQNTAEKNVGREIPIYIGSPHILPILPANDLYLAFNTAGISKTYLETMIGLISGLRAESKKEDKGITKLILDSI